MVCYHGTAETLPTMKEHFWLTYPVMMTMVLDRSNEGGDTVIRAAL